MLACRRAPGSPRKRAGGSARQVLVEPRRVWQTSSGAVDPCLSVPAAVPGKRLRKPKTDGVRGSPFAHGRRLIGGGASSEELLSGGVQRQQDPDRGQHDHRRDEVLGVGGDRRPEDQRGDYEEGLLDPCDLPLGTTELHASVIRARVIELISSTSSVLICSASASASIEGSSPICSS